ncbi:hypothetical protein D3C75_1217720 [compost metagenome]
MDKREHTVNEAEVRRVNFAVNLPDFCGIRTDNGRTLRRSPEVITRINAVAIVVVVRDNSVL